VLFVVTVMAAEMVPLFPTQPLSLASGLLFGPKKVRLGVPGPAAGDSLSFTLVHATDITHLSRVQQGCVHNQESHVLCGAILPDAVCDWA
jgi:hypothetical protein